MESRINASIDWLDERTIFINILTHIMCGIVGKFDLNGNNNTSRNLLDKMLYTINHRGPDERGIYLNKNFCFGTARLSIIDLENGQQPLCNSSGILWIAFNGEIFNYIELKEELIKKGYKFKTQSDTEVVLAGYEIWGTKVLSKLNGQFAIAIWDKSKQELFLARDRVGICPLYYTVVNDCIVFASEIKAMLADPMVKPEISMEALCQLITFWSVLSPSTLFKNIQELPPGHYLKANKKGIISECYWSLQFNPQKINTNIAVKDACDEFERILTSSVKLRLRAEVPVAAYLSGGIDSTTTTALINKISPKQLNTFSIRFKEEAFDEADYQKEVVQFFNTNHKSVVCNNYMISEGIPNAIWHAESPMLRSTSVPMQYLSKLVRQNDIKVVITGEGADELLGGYDIFKEMVIRRFWAREPNSKFRPLLIKKLYPYIPQINNANVNILKFFYGFKLKDTSLPYYSHIMRWNGGQHILKYLHPDHKILINEFNPYDMWLKSKPTEFDNWGELAKAQHIEATQFMSGYLLSTQGDRMTMSNSVEGRYPFLDHRLIEFLSTLPENFKLKGLNEKYLLKKTMNGKIPDSIIQRPKQAYRSPIGPAFFNGSKVDYFDSLVSNNKVNEYGVFDQQKVRNIIDKIHKSKFSTEMENMVIMTIISTQLFYKMFILGEPKTGNEKPNNTLRIINDN